MLRRLLALAAAVTLLSACGGPATVQLADLALEADEYDGERVTTVGVVAEFDEDDGATHHHVVVQDGDDHRVELLPTDAALEHVGEVVEVTGEFGFDPERGRSIAVEEISDARD